MNLSNQDHNVKKESDPNKKKNKINQQVGLACSPGNDDSENSYPVSF